MPQISRKFALEFLLEARGQFRLASARERFVSNSVTGARCSAKPLPLKIQFPSSNKNDLYFAAASGPKAKEVKKFRLQMGQGIDKKISEELRYDICIARARVVQNFERRSRGFAIVEIEHAA